MSNILIQTLLIALVISVSCAYLGSMLFLRKMILVTDAISHTVLLGIVITYLIFQDLSSLWMLFGASIVGVFTVIAIESLTKNKCIKEDAAIATVYAILFSIAIIIISTQLRHTLLSKHALFGNLEFAAFRQINLFGSIELSVTLLYASMVLMVLFILGTLFFKHLVMTTFDAVYAAHAGVAVVLIHYGLMSLVSVTIVSSFQALGVILVITMMVAPIATVSFYSLSLKTKIISAIIVAIINVLLGFFIVFVVLQGRVNIASTIATVAFVVFLLNWIFSPHQGLIAAGYKKQVLKRKIYRDVVFNYLNQFQSTGVPCKVLYKQGMSERVIRQTVKFMLKAGWITENNESYFVTIKGVKQYNIS